MIPVLVPFPAQLVLEPSQESVAENFVVSGDSLTETHEVGTELLFDGLLFCHAPQAVKSEVLPIYLYLLLKKVPLLLCSFPFLSKCPHAV